jgi:Na+/melibiose symporter-like transporter
MAMCRRVLILVFVSIRPEQAILVISLVVFNTGLIVVNAVWNRPYKIYGRCLPCVEGLFAGFLVLVEIIIVNMTSMSVRVWEVLSWICFVVLVGMIGLCNWVAINETVKIIRKCMGKYRKGDDAEQG